MNFLTHLFVSVQVTVESMDCSGDKFREAINL